MDRADVLRSYFELLFFRILLIPRFLPNLRGVLFGLCSRFYQDDPRRFPSLRDVLSVDASFLDVSLKPRLYTPFIPSPQLFELHCRVVRVNVEDFISEAASIGTKKRKETILLRRIEHWAGRGAFDQCPQSNKGNAPGLVLQSY